MGGGGGAIGPPSVLSYIQLGVYSGALKGACPKYKVGPLRLHRHVYYAILSVEITRSEN